MAKTSAQRWVLLVLMSITIVYNTVFFLLLLFQVEPVQYLWTGWDGGEPSIDQSFVALVSYGFSGVGAGTDWGLVLVSPWFFWEKDMGGRVKLCLRVLLVLGIWYDGRSIVAWRGLHVDSAGAAALVRISVTRALLTTDDFFLDCLPIAIGYVSFQHLGFCFGVGLLANFCNSSVVESGLGMIALAASTFRPLYPGFFDVKKEVPVQAPNPDGKSSLDSTTGKETSSGTGAQVPVQGTTQRKLSNDQAPKGWRICPSRLSDHIGDGCRI